MVWCHTPKVLIGGLIVALEQFGINRAKTQQVKKSDLLVFCFIPRGRLCYFRPLA